MNKKLTDDCDFVREFDSLASDIYEDKKFYHLNIKQIAEYRELTLFEAKTLYVRAKTILKNRDQAWMVGLSNRAKLAILATNKYNDFAGLYNDVMSNNEDLERLPKIGHKVALEIHGWIIKKKAC